MGEGIYRTGVVDPIPVPVCDYSLSVLGNDGYGVGSRTDRYTLTVSWEADGGYENKEAEHVVYPDV